MTQRPQKKSKTGISTETSEFIKRKKRTILKKRYTNCTVTSITTGRKRRRMMIWCGDNVEKMRPHPPQQVTQKKKKKDKETHTNTRVTRHT